MLVIDVLHEIEHGIWKEIFAHLVRILFAYCADNVGILDERYAAQPTAFHPIDLLAGFDLFRHSGAISANFTEMHQK